MITVTSYLNAIEKLRENREQLALVTLHNSNTTRDNAVRAATRFENYLRQQTAAQRAEEARLYEETLGKTLAPQELETVYSRIQRESSEIEALAQQCEELKDEAAKAEAAAEEACRRHARLLRAKKKWAKLRERHAEQGQIEDLYREEIIFDDLQMPANGF